MNTMLEKKIDMIYNLKPKRTYYYDSPEFFNFDHFLSFDLNFLNIEQREVASKIKLFWGNRGIFDEEKRDYRYVLCSAFYDLDFLRDYESKYGNLILKSSKTNGKTEYEVRSLYENSSLKYYISETIFFIDFRILDGVDNYDEDRNLFRHIKVMRSKIKKNILKMGQDVNNFEYYLYNDIMKKYFSDFISSFDYRKNKDLFDGCSNIDLFQRNTKFFRRYNYDL